MTTAWLCSVNLMMLLSWAHAGGIKGPPQLKPHKPFVAVQLGHQVKLPCPITAYPEPYYEWEKDGAPIDETWSKYQTRKHFLKIRESELSDSGDYVCQGVNGFGKESFTFNVHIYEGSLPPADQLRLPTFTELSPRSALEVPTGEETSFICRATGVPEPKISWYKNGSPLHRTGSRLFVGRVELKHQGTYSCRAKNPLGVISYNFTLAVQDHEFDREMEILEMTNTTANEGFNTTLHCLVKSPLPPKIQWFKKLSQEEFEALPPQSRNNTFHREKRIYLSVTDQNEQMALVNGTYVSKLHLIKASARDAGTYVCVCVTANGHNYQEVFLNVIKGDARSRVNLDQTSGSESYWLLALLPFLCILGLGSIVYLILRYRKNLPEKSLPKAGPKASTHSEDPLTNVPLNPFGPQSKGGQPPPDIVYQEENKYPVQRSMMTHIKGSSRYPDHYIYPETSYLDPNYSEPYLDPQDASAATDSRGYGTRSSEHSYARLTQSTQSSTSPLPPPPYAYQFPYSPPPPPLFHHPHHNVSFSHASYAPRSQDEPHFVVHYNL